MRDLNGNEGRCTLAGVLAILMWASLVATARRVGEEMGVLTAATAANLLGGSLACLLGFLRHRDTRRLLHLPWKYLVGCGLLFVLYNLTFYSALEGSCTREQVVLVALVNYLWPALTLVLSVPLLNKKAGPILLPGLLTAVAGIWLALSRGGAVSCFSLLAEMQGNPEPPLLALTAAVAWGLYSNLARRWGGDAGANAVPLFLVGAGLALLGLRYASGGAMAWPVSHRGLLELVYLGLFPTTLAYVLWDIAMRRGDMVLVASLSLLIPVISTVISCAYLDVSMTLSLWIGCGLVTGGAVLCRSSIRDA